MPKLTCKFFLVLSLSFLPIFTHAQSTLININTASLEELDTLPGVGPTIAQRIIDGRPYTAVGEISKVQGIGGPGSSTYEKIIGLITVGESSSGGGGTAATSTPNTTTTSTTSSSSSSSGGSSAHYSSSGLSTRSPDAVISLGAGRDRLGSVGSPLEFKVESNIEYLGNSIFRWNFGDGSTGEGDVLNHTYEYPGEYVVVLNASVVGRGEAVARINVRIIDPELAITLATPGRIELKNNSKQEASLYGRALWAGGKAFVFSQDTIIKAGQSLSFSSRVTGLEPVSALDTQLMVVGNTEQAKLVSKIEEEKSNRIAYLQNEIAALQQQLASLEQPHLAVRQLSGVAVTSEESGVEEVPAEPGESQAQTQTASAGDGWVTILKKFFLRTQ